MNPLAELMRALISDGSRHFEGGCPQKGGHSPDITEKEIRYLGYQILSFTNIR
jgi:hypothetical protein